MGEMTVTEAVRTLLAEGLTSGEVIARGYRPGTVYKVQRSMRLAAAHAQAAPGEFEGEELEGLADTSAAQTDEPEDAADVWDVDEHLDALEAGLSHASEHIAELTRSGDARFEGLERQFAGLSQRVSDVESQAAALHETVKWLRETAADVITLLAKQTMSPAHPLLWVTPVTGALERIRQRLIAMNPTAARSLFGDRIEGWSGLRATRLPAQLGSPQGGGLRSA